MRNEEGGRRNEERGNGWDALKERVKEMIQEAGAERRFVTARELLLALPVDSSDPMRCVKKRIEELRDEGCPIVGLPQSPGPGYTWLHETESPWARNVIELFEEDMRGRVKSMMVHLALVKRYEVRRVQEEMFGEKALSAGTKGIYDESTNRG